MGCCGTAVPVSPKLPNKQNHANTDKDQKRVHVCASMFRDLLRVNSGISRIPRPEEVCSVVCVSENSIPIALTHTAEDLDDSLYLQLPALGLARSENGRVVAAGNINILVDCKPENAEYLAFLENLLHFCAGNHPPSPTVLLFGISPTSATIIQQNMAGLGFAAEKSNNITDLSKYAVVITLASTPFSSEIADYVRNGGGLIVCADVQSTKACKKANRWIMEFGIGFGDCKMEVISSKKAVMRASLHPDELERCTLPFLVMVYKDILAHEENIKIDDLRYTVIMLRHHIAAFTRCENAYLKELTDISWDYLKRSNFEQPDGMCCTDEHAIVSLLLCDAIKKLDARFFEGKSTLAKVFPGIYAPEIMETAEIVVTFQSNNIHSTGLWLPAGVISTVTCKNCESTKNMVIQIGAHSESLLETPGPWKRWPIVTQSFDVDEFPMEISSPYGGLIYIVNTSTEAAKTHRLSFKFTNVCYAPTYKDTNKSWMDTKHLMPPWCEIHTKNAIFTVPSEIVRDVEDFSGFVNQFDELSQELILFMGFNAKRKFRIVFDIDLPKDGSVNSYPLMLHYDFIEGILLSSGPTRDLFALIMMMAIVCLPEGSLDMNVEAALGALAASHVFTKKWQNISPFDFTYQHMSPAFNELWSVYTQNDRKLFPTALTRFYQSQLRNATSPDESIKYIVDELSAIAEKEFTSQLANVLDPTLAAAKAYPRYEFLDKDA